MWPQDIVACGMPARLHPVSQMFLDRYVEGAISLDNFLRFFSLPNSDYIPLAQCIVQTLSAIGLVDASAMSVPTVRP